MMLIKKRPIDALTNQRYSKKKFFPSQAICKFIFLAGALALAACEPAQQSQFDEKAKAILAKMTLEEKIGQVLQGDISATSPEDVRKYNLGSVLNGGNSAPKGGKTADWQEWVDLADAYWQASTDASDGGVAIPYIWGTDAVHGHNNLQTATIFPHNIGLGAANDADLVRRIGEVTAREVRGTGLDWTFAPTLAVVQDDRWGRSYEGYSEDPKIVSRLGAAMLVGLQGAPNSDAFLDEYHVIATAKHFVGDGGTQYGIDKGDLIGTPATVRATHAYPYEAAIGNDAQTVMSSFSSVNGVKMHGAKDLLTGLLRDEMKFDGFVIGDWNGHAEIPGCTSTDCPDALLAGVDMYMAPDSWKGLYETLLAQAKSGELPMARLDEAVLRILEVKLRAGVFDAGLPSQRVGTDETALGTEANRAVAREAVRKSLVLLKNNDATLPVNPTKRILVVGDAANSMQQQTGGWTLSWQGNDNANEEFKTGETIYQGLATAITQAGGQIDFSADGSFDQKPDMAIFVFGEQPYAEFVGDRQDTVYEFEDGAHLAVINKLKAQDIPVVSVFITGRPLWVNPHINASDAFVVAWLPGTEAGGVADVLVADKQGKARHDFAGRLSFSWPGDGTGMPINGAEATGAQFALGYGLNYRQATQTAAFSENPGIEKASDAFTGQIVARGAASAPLSVFLGDQTNANSPAPAFNTASLGGSITSSGVDYRAQEDARRLSWAGDNEATLSVRAPRPVDFARIGATAELALKLTLRVDAAGNGPIFAGMACGDNCGARVDMTKLLGEGAIGEWREAAIPLSCFTKAGLDASNVTVPLAMETAAQWQISVHDARLGTAKGVRCP